MHVILGLLQLTPLILTITVVVYLDTATASIAVLLLGLCRHWPQSDLGESVIEHKLDTLFERAVGPIESDESYKTLHQAVEGDPTPAVFTQKQIDLQQHVEVRTMIVRGVQSFGFYCLAAYLIFRITQGA